MQICENTEGSYNCKCEADFKVDPTNPNNCEGTFFQKLCNRLYIPKAIPNNTQDCSQSSIFWYFSSIAECANRNVRKLDFLDLACFEQQQIERLRTV